MDTSAQLKCIYEIATLTTLRDTHSRTISLYVIRHFTGSQCSVSTLVCSSNGVRVTKRAVLCWMDISRFIWVFVRLASRELQSFLTEMSPNVLELTYYF